MPFSDSARKYRTSDSIHSEDEEPLMDEEALLGSPEADDIEETKAKRNHLCETLSKEHQRARSLEQSIYMKTVGWIMLAAFATTIGL
ncbi:hypothetical protein NQZ79_g4076 [Umbelopsis isabellina]|nr:hypothetical protein NQZ79_g4076 [Umbelopsis isabellina]